MYLGGRPTNGPIKHVAAPPRRRDASRKILVVACIGGFVAVAILYVRTAAQVEEMSLSATAIVSDSSVVITGSTTLPPGAILRYSIRDAQGDELASGHYEVSETEIIVQHPITPTTTKPSQVVFTFSVFMEDRAQPPVLIERFGAAGQRMASNRMDRGPYGRRLIWRIDVTD